MDVAHQFIYLSDNRHLACLCLLANLNNTTMNIHVPVLGWACVFISLGYIKEMDLPGHMVSLGCIF